MTCETNKMDFYKAMVFASWGDFPRHPYLSPGGPPNTGRIPA